MMLTYDSINQKLKPYGYHVIVLLLSRYGYGDNVALVKCSDIDHPLVNLDLGTLQHLSYDYCSYQSMRYLPDKVALLFKHFMEDALKYGLKKTFNNHIKDYDDSDIFYGTDDGYYANHDHYTRMFYDRLYGKIARKHIKHDMKSLKSDFKDLNTFSKFHYNWKDINHTYNYLKKLLSK